METIKQEARNHAPTWHWQKQRNQTYQDNNKTDKTQEYSDWNDINGNDSDEDTSFIHDDIHFKLNK